jgi:hypothetical protein
MSCNTMSHYMSYYIMSHYILSHHFTPRHVMSHRIALGLKFVDIVHFVVIIINITIITTTIITIIITTIIITVVIVITIITIIYQQRDGAGILVSRDVYEGIRQAQPSDVRAVEDIIRPFEEQVHCAEHSIFPTIFKFFNIMHDVIVAATPEHYLSKFFFLWS